MNKQFCPKHPSLFINPKYGKCNKCRKIDGDLVVCKVCEIAWHGKQYQMCYECMGKTNRGGENV